MMISLQSAFAVKSH